MSAAIRLGRWLPPKSVREAIGGQQPETEQEVRDEDAQHEEGAEAEHRPARGTRIRCLARSRGLERLARGEPEGERREQDQHPEGARVEAVEEAGRDDGGHAEVGQGLMVGRVGSDDEDRGRGGGCDDPDDEEEQARPGDRRADRRPHQAVTVSLPCIDGFSLPPQQMSQYQLYVPAVAGRRELEHLAAHGADLPVDAEGIDRELVPAAAVAVHRGIHAAQLDLDGLTGLDGQRPADRTRPCSRGPGPPSYRWRRAPGVDSRPDRSRRPRQPARSPRTQQAETVVTEEDLEGGRPPDLAPRGCGEWAWCSVAWAVRDRRVMSLSFPRAVRHASTPPVGGDGIGLRFDRMPPVRGPSEASRRPRRARLDSAGSRRARVRRDG